MSNEKPSIGTKILKFTLLLGGIPPMLSGLFAMFGTDLYIKLMNPAIQSLFSTEGYSLLLGVWGLQGGDAFVGGISRVFVAWKGEIRLMQLFALVGIFHSGYELYLLPAKFLSLSFETTGAAPSQIFYTEIWAFIALHIILVIGFVAGFLLTLRDSKANPEAIR